MSEFLGIIPARYASTRFPGKPLALLGKKPMIQWVFERASILFNHLVVATDDQRILHVVRDFGGRAVMTRPDHRTGTERCAEALKLYQEKTNHSFSHVVNIQGDEPLIQAEQLQKLIDCFKVPGTGIATLIRPLLPHEEPGNPNMVKVVVDKSWRALYFSRAPIPYGWDSFPDHPSHIPGYYVHIGLYAFRSEVLEEIVRLPPSRLELSESLEQLRWLENGITLQTAVTDLTSIGVDTPEDLDRIEREGLLPPI